MKTSNYAREIVRRHVEQKDTKAVPIARIRKTARSVTGSIETSFITRLIRAMAAGEYLIPIEESPGKFNINTAHFEGDG